MSAYLVTLLNDAFDGVWILIRCPAWGVERRLQLVASKYIEYTRDSDIRREAPPTLVNYIEGSPPDRGAVRIVVE